MNRLLKPKLIGIIFIILFSYSVNAVFHSYDQEKITGMVIEEPTEEKNKGESKPAQKQIPVISWIINFFSRWFG